PELQTTGEDFNRIWRSINAYYVWLGRHPNPDLLDEIFEKECDCYKPNRSQLQLMSERGWRYEDAGVQVKSVKLNGRPVPTTAVLIVVDQQGPQLLVDRKGKVVRRGTGWRATRRIFVLRLHSDQRWRLSATSQPGPA
ncbi:MAG TPA: hypothetical protein VKG45_09840, partial [Actinomycetes bacterium]|nr:hypothetical protein [Actinomycetes bacterium]